MALSISTFSNLRPYKIYPKWYFRFENKPSGNTHDAFIHSLHHLLWIGLIWSLMRCVNYVTWARPTGSGGQSTKINKRPMTTCTSFQFSRVRAELNTFVNFLFTRPLAPHLFHSAEENYVNKFYQCPGWRRGAMDITSASGTEDPGSNPAWVHTY
jgi:hypothetical protein